MKRPRCEFCETHGRKTVPKLRSCETCLAHIAHNMCRQTRASTKETSKRRKGYSRLLRLLGIEGLQLPRHKLVIPGHQNIKSPERLSVASTSLTAICRWLAHLASRPERVALADQSLWWCSWQSSWHHYKLISNHILCQAVLWNLRICDLRHS